MNLIETIKTPGKNITSSLNGRIQLDEAQARLVISQENGVERVVHNIDGSFYNDEQGNNMTLVDTRGINTIDPDTGMYRGRWGIATVDDRPFGGFSKDGSDIRQLLGE